MSNSTKQSALVLGALGVVFGDIGTSPIYTMREVFSGGHALAPTVANVLGILSLIFWSLLLVVALKYVAFIMRADNKGEGGIMALIALSQRAVGNNGRLSWILMSLGIFGAALFYGDCVITPAISVLSAAEGLKVAAPHLEHFVIPIALIILTGMFLFQHKGTGGMGALFGPVMCVWFLTLGVLGAISIVQYPEVLAAINPYYAVQHFVQHKAQGFFVLGSVVLAVTGAEALYADMGHFGKRSIRIAWFGLVFPALLLNYFGQGALIIHDATAVTSPFYLLAPSWGLYPLIILTTAATVIASQAVISGAFSITRQAVQLGYIPRMVIQHTSDEAIGQIYIPFVNRMLFVGVIALVLGFKSSSNLAAAYGIAVTGTMAIDTILAFVVVRTVWGWGWGTTIAGLVFFLTIDLAFFGANIPKIVHGGWFPLLIAAVFFTVLTTWKRGRQILAARMQTNAFPLEPFMDDLVNHSVQRVPGTAVFLSSNRENTMPHAMLHNLKHNKILHERVILLTLVPRDIPYVKDVDRVKVIPLGNNFYRVTVDYGFKDDPNIPYALNLCIAKGLDFDMMDTTFFLSRQTVIASKTPGMAIWREHLFTGMVRNSGSPASYFKIPTNRVVELGMQVEI
ncbi:MAG: potassium transporter Kup [Gammaproteobacteria bacterium]|nr:potassium transporter Kup [Gammaproteobacteria bacterium]